MGSACHQSWPDSWSRSIQASAPRPSTPMPYREGSDVTCSSTPAARYPSGNGGSRVGPWPALTGRNSSGGIIARPRHVRGAGDQHFCRNAEARHEAPPLDETADGHDWGGAVLRRRDLEVQMPARRAADIALVPQIGAGLDHVARLELRPPARRMLAHVRVLGPLAVGVLEPDVVVVALPRRARVLPHAELVDDVADDPRRGGDDPMRPGLGADEVESIR